MKNLINKIMEFSKELIASFKDFLEKLLSEIEKEEIVEPPVEVDNISPEFQPVDDIIFNMEHDQDTTVITWNKPLASDNIDVDVEITQIEGKASGSSFGEGTYTIIYRAIDKAGNFTDLEFKITINKKEAPVVVEPEVFKHDWNFRITSIKTEQIWTDWDEIPNPTKYDRIEVQVREQGNANWSINGTNTTDDTNDITVGLSKDTDYEMRLVLFNFENEVVDESKVIEFYTEQDLPVVTTKEVTETNSLDFSISQTNIESNAKVGEKGIAETIYKITYHDGIQVSKESIGYTIIKETINEVIYIADEVIDEELIQGLTTDFLGVDDITNTLILRNEFNISDTIYKIPEGRFYTLGKLPEDPKTEYTFIGEYKDDTGKVVPFNIDYTVQKDKSIVTIEGKDNVTIEGQGDKETTLYTIDPAIWDGDVDGDGISEQGWIRNGSHMSQRKFFKVRNSNHFTLTNLGVESNNLIPVHKANRPEYDSAFEFEHLVDIANSNYVHLENLYGKGLWGDGVYIRDSFDVYVKNVTIDWNGRQGGAMISGSRGYFEKYNVLNSRRSGFDIEGNTINNNTKDFVITYSHFDTHLYGLPMGGAGAVENVLCINNVYTGSGTSMYSRGDGKTRLRKNIIFSNNKHSNVGSYLHTENVLVDGGLITNNDLEDKVAAFNDSFGLLVVRNLKRAEGYVGENKFIIAISGITTPDMFRIYNNEAPVFFRYPDGTLEEAKEYTPTSEEIGKIPFETSEWMEMQWERLYTNGYGWREENYVDDGWRPKWINDIKK